jgi:hypothetical protein
MTKIIDGITFTEEDQQCALNIIAHQEKMRSARDEFNAAWEASKPELGRKFGAIMQPAELLAWKFFKLGKGLKP